MYLVTKLEKNNILSFYQLKAFSLAEMMVVMLILSIVLAASMPIITKRSRVAVAAPITSNLPPGSIIAYASNSIPDGWLLCNGQSTASYPALAAVIGANVPDLRGEFIRGLDTRTSGYIDPYYAEKSNTARTLGSLQTDAFQGHWHYLIEPSWGGGFGSSMVGSGGSYPVARYLGTGSIMAGTIMTDSTNGIPRITTETRPRNIALNYIIKY